MHHDYKGHYTSLTVRVKRLTVILAHIDEVGGMDHPHEAVSRTPVDGVLLSVILYTVGTAYSFYCTQREGVC